MRGYVRVPVAQGDEAMSDEIVKSEEHPKSGSLP
jgi:hypothetical protein